MKFEFRKPGLLMRVLVAIALGVAIGRFAPEFVLRLGATFNVLVGQFLKFIVPLIIIGLVTPAIGEIGGKAGRLLLATVSIAYIDTLLAGLLAYGAGTLLFPGMVSAGANVASGGAAAQPEPFFEISIPPMCDVMSAIVFSFILGLGVAYMKEGNVLGKMLLDFREVVSKTIARAVIPLLPFYIFSIFLLMAASGEAGRIVSAFAKVVVVVFVLHIVTLAYEFLIAGAVVRRNPLKLLWTMAPAYMTALGTSSSAATIPVTFACVKKLGVQERIAAFTVPLCANIHMSGSAMKLTACALALSIMQGLPHGFGEFLHFTALLGIVIVAAPGVPGGAVMASLGVIGSILGFSEADQALMIALYIAMDSFGTACNVTGDGAISLVVDRIDSSDRERLK